MQAPPLTRTALAAARGTDVQLPPVRIVHLGLGAFHRAHQAWFTDRAEDAPDWGIAAFTGRTPEAALQLAPQDGLYVLLERAPDGDTATIVESIVEAADGANLERLAELLSVSSTAIVTITVSEAGYRLDAAGHPDSSDALLAADLRYLTAALGRRDLLAEPAGRPRTTLGRLLLGLEARRRAGGGPIAFVPCDNLPDNGRLVATGLASLAAGLAPELAAFVDDSVSFVSTSVDRITPRTSAEDVATAAALSGWADAAPVVTEPFKDWILCGRFPAGRPHWETAGARFVDDLEPFERRKLWMLNGAHSLLAYAGLERGYETVAEAIADPQCLRWVHDYWDEVACRLQSEELELASYRASLLDRFGNPRISYRLRQIATDGLAKLRVRIAPVVLAGRADGHAAEASTRVIAAWISLILHGAAFDDSESGAIAAALAQPSQTAIAELVRLVDPRLVEDPHVLGAILRIAAQATPAGRDL